jgi:hypothetical protein
MWVFHCTCDDVKDFPEGRRTHIFHFLHLEASCCLPDEQRAAGIQYFCVKAPCRWIGLAGGRGRAAAVLQL